MRWISIGPSSTQCAMAYMTFGICISVLPGYYPTSIRDAVGRLVANSVIPPAILDEASSTESVSETQLEVPGLPDATSP